MLSSGFKKIFMEWELFYSELFTGVSIVECRVAFAIIRYAGWQHDGSIVAKYDEVPKDCKFTTILKI